MTDVDDFKQFNDAYGHLAGDEALQPGGKALTSAALRPADLVARYGGEEFVILLPDTGANEAALVADRLLLAVRRLAIPHEHSRGWQFLSLSVGLASARPSPQCRRQRAARPLRPHALPGEEQRPEPRRHRQSRNPGRARRHRSFSPITRSIRLRRK